MFERRVSCPQCGREIRLTEAELADKRGFCALCDARFDLLGDMVLGGGPMREQLTTRVALALAPPPSERVAVESVAPDAAIVLRPRRPRHPVALFLLTGVSLALWIGSGFAASGWGKLFVVCQLLSAFSMARRLVWTRTLRERVWVEGGALRLSRSVAGLRLSSTTVALDGVVELKVRETPALGVTSDASCMVTVASTLSSPVALGKRLGLDSKDADWLRNVLTARLRNARG